LDPVAYAKLNRVNEARIEYYRLCAKVEELEAMAEKVTPHLSDTVVQGAHSLKDDTWAKLVDYKMQCQWQLDLYAESCKALDSELDVIRDVNIRTAMKYRYVDGYPPEDIAKALSYDVRSVFRYLKKGRAIYESYYK